MKFTINKDILIRANKCKEGYSCIKGDIKCLCEVESSISNGMLFVKTAYALCNYSMAFGYSHICKCPVRNEINNRYKQ